MSTYVVIYALILGALFASPPSVQADSRLVNISTRARVETGDNVMIGGFIIEGDTPKTVLVRAIGPSLAAFGVPGALANPLLRLFSGQTAIAENDNWQATLPLCQQTGHTCGDAAAIAATGAAPTSPLESALLITLAPGPYTAIVSGFGGSTGVGLVEVFEPSQTSPDIRGTYTISGTVTQSQCLNPAANTTFVFVGDSVTVAIQNGASFSGTGRIVESIGGAIVRVDFVLVGTVNAAGQISGTLNTSLFIDNVFDASSVGTFSGSVVGNTITLSATGQVVGGGCVFTASLSGTR